MSSNSDIHSECCLLARMLISINAVNDAIDNLKSEDFFDPTHQAIFSSMCILYKQDCEIEPVSVATVLKKEFPKFSEAAYVFGLKIHQYGDYQEVKIFINSIKELSRLRKFKDIAHQLSLEVLGNKKNSNEIYNDHLIRIENIFSENYEKNVLTAAQIINQDYSESGKDFINYVQQQMENHKNGINLLRGVPTGFSRVDNILSGFCKGHYIILGARPGVGKTTMALNMIHSLISKGVSVGFFSLEMTAQEAIKKLIGIDSGVDMERCERGNITPQEFHKILCSTKNIESLPLIIDDQESLNVSNLIARTKRMVQVNKVEILFVDYLAEVKGDGKFNTKQDEIQYVSKCLRGLAKKLRIPIVCIAQLNRDNEKENRAPRKSDLRDSGQIEADAHSILLLHKPSQDNQNDCPGEVRMHVVKNRFGKEGVIYFNFDGKTGVFRQIEYGANNES